MLEAGLDVEVDDGIGRFVVQNHDRGRLDSQRLEIILLPFRVLLVPLNT